MKRPTAQILVPVNGALTNIAAGARATFNVGGPVMNLTPPTGLIRVRLVSGNIVPELAADTNILMLDNMQVGVNFLDGAGQFITFLPLAETAQVSGAGAGVAGSPIPFSNGHWTQWKGKLWIPADLVLTGNVIRAVQISVSADLHNPGAAGHRAQLFLNGLIDLFA